MRPTHRLIRAAAVALAASIVLGVPASALVRGNDKPELPPAKQATQDVIAQTREAALRAPIPPKDALAVGPERLPEPAWPTGIIESGQAPYPGSVYRFQNQWHDIVGGEHVNVFAGALHDDPQQGIVAVQFTALDITGPASAGGVYRAPVRSGSVRIVAAAAGVLTLAATDGTRFTFDVVTRTFSAV